MEWSCIELVLIYFSLVGSLKVRTCHYMDDLNESIEVDCIADPTPQNQCHSEIFGINRRSYLQIRTLIYPSSCKVENEKQLNPGFFDAFKNLEVLKISGNDLTKLYPFKLLKLNKLVITYNELIGISGTNFVHLKRIVDMDFSFNKITSIECESFSQLIELKTLNMSNNRIEALNEDLFNYNRKLEMLQLGNNPIHKLDFLNGVRNQLTDLSIRNLKLTVNHFNNAANLFSYFGSSLEVLDLSLNFIGRLTSSTFKTLTNLQSLNLSGTNLSNFGIETFQSVKGLKILDLSDNRLGKINFTLMDGNFRALNELHLEGNELSELNSLTPTIFPNLTALAISKNCFTCEHLASFLSKWGNLTLISNPSGGTHIGGADCYMRRNRRGISTSTIILIGNIALLFVISIVVMIVVLLIKSRSSDHETSFRRNFTISCCVLCMQNVRFDRQNGN